MRAFLLYAGRLVSRGRKAEVLMTDEPTDIAILDTGWLAPAVVATLGESVLRHALQRRQTDADGLGLSTPIAAFQDSI